MEKYHLISLVNFILLTSLQFSLPQLLALNTDYSDIEVMSSRTMRDIAIETIIGLQQEAVQTQNQAKWPRIIDSPPTEWLGGWYQYYYGYWWGAAGIGDILLTFYSTFENQSLLSFAEQAANFIIDGAQQYTGGGLYWYPAEGLQTKYFGMKYGNAGIATFLLHLYEQTNNNTYLNYLNQTLKTLEKEAINDSHSKVYWGIAINDTRDATDLIYGTAGIAGIFLEAGLSINKSQWIDYAIKSGKWLESISLNRSIDGSETMAVPWSDTPPFNDTFYTGLGGGNAGIGKFFLNLYWGTGDKKWLEDSKKFGNYLLKEKINDSWINGGPSYATELDGYDPITGMDSGVAGIGHFFLELYKETLEIKYANGAIDIASWLISHASRTGSGIKWPKATTGIDMNVSLTGYSYGAAGIGDFFSQVYVMFGCPQVKEAMIGAAIWLDSQRTLMDRYPVATGETRLTSLLNQYGHHLSFYDGAAGIALFFLNAANRYDAITLYPNIISCGQIPSFVNSSDDSVNQIEGLIFSIFGLFFISMIIIIALIPLKKRNGV
ncbi:MAG: lanthionine synthetase LanC family protein [Candidatus Hodarchaeales archaeon]